MSEERGSPWERLKARLNARREAVVEDIISGACSPPQYHDRCGRHAELLQTLREMDWIARGGDLRHPEPPPDLDPSGLL